MRYHHVMSDYYYSKLISKLLDSIRASDGNLIWEEKNIPTQIVLFPLISQFHHIEFTTMKTMNDDVHNRKKKRKNNAQKRQSTAI